MKTNKLKQKIKLRFAIFDAMLIVRCIHDFNYSAKLLERLMMILNWLLKAKEKSISASKQPTLATVKHIQKRVFF